MKVQALVLSAALWLGSCVFGGPITYTAQLAGANENPPNGSTATGFASITLDTMAHLLTVDVTFQGLTMPATASHIHCCVDPPGNVGVATQTPSFTGFPNATSGAYLHVFDTTLASSFSAAFITANGGTAAGAEAALEAGLLAGRAYLNIHTSTYPGGEIRGFLAQAVPEPSTLALAGFALAGIVLARRKRRGR